MHKAAKRVGYCVGTLLVVVAIVLFFWPESKTKELLDSTITAFGNGNCNVAGTGNHVNCASMPQKVISQAPMVPVPLPQPVPEKRIAAQNDQRPSALYVSKTAR
jgi:hypothetical protein